jgi:hypothetical protein
LERYDAASGNRAKVSTVTREEVEETPSSSPRCPCTARRARRCASKRVKPTRAAVLGVSRRIMGRLSSTGREVASVAVA